MATVQRPSLIIFEWNFGFSLIPKIRACSKMVRSQFDHPSRRRVARPPGPLAKVPPCCRHTLPESSGFVPIST
jgi:hypothetical protein